MTLLWYVGHLLSSVQSQVIRGDRGSRENLGSQRTPVDRGPFSAIWNVFLRLERHPSFDLMACKELQKTVN